MHNLSLRGAQRRGNLVATRAGYTNEIAALRS